jgi:hypothetical protein
MLSGRNLWTRFLLFFGAKASTRRPPIQHPGSVLIFAYSKGVTVVYSFSNLKEEERAAECPDVWSPLRYEIGSGGVRLRRRAVLMHRRAPQSPALVVTQLRSLYDAARDRNKRSLETRRFWVQCSETIGKLSQTSLHYRSCPAEPRTASSKLNEATTRSGLRRNRYFSRYAFP